MAIIKKNVAAAPKSVLAKEPAAKVEPKPAVKAAAPKPVKVTKPEVTTEQETGTTSKRVSRKELSVTIVAKLKEAGFGVPPSIAERMVTAYEESVGEALGRGEEVVLPGFGKFKVKLKPAGTARNPATGEQMPTLAKMVPSFKVGAKLKEAANPA